MAPAAGLLPEVALNLGGQVQGRKVKEGFRIPLESLPASLSPTPAIRASPGALFSGPSFIDFEGASF